jgi:arylsulfatase A-like enzyme
VDHPGHGSRFLSDADRVVHRTGDFRTASPARPDWPQVSRIFTGLYAGEVTFADAAVGELLAAFDGDDLLDDTVVVLTSDHGENLADHPPHFSHNDALFDSLLHVPLIFAGPGVEEGREVTGQVGLTDLGRTLLDLAGLEAPEGFGGRSLAPVLRGAELEPADVVPGDAGLQKVRLLCLRTSGQKVLRDGEGAAVRFTRFDLVEDPGEREPREVRSDHPLARRLEAWILDQRRRHEEWNSPPDGTTDRRTPEEIEQLRAFGYLR